MKTKTTFLWIGLIACILLMTSVILSGYSKALNTSSFDVREYNYLDKMKQDMKYMMSQGYKVDQFAVSRENGGRYAGRQTYTVMYIK